MKKLMLVLALLAMVALACGGGGGGSVGDYEKLCQASWDSLSSSGLSSGVIMQTVLNQNWAPNTVGQQVKDCLNTGWRPTGV